MVVYSITCARLNFYEYSSLRSFMFCYVGVTVCCSKEKSDERFFFFLVSYYENKWSALKIISL